MFGLIGDWFCIEFKRINCHTTEALLTSNKNPEIKTQKPEGENLFSNRYSAVHSKFQNKISFCHHHRPGQFYERPFWLTVTWISFVWLSLCIKRNFVNSSHLMVQPFSDLILDNSIGWWHWHHMLFPVLKWYTHSNTKL